MSNTQRSAKAAFEAFREHHELHQSLAPSPFDRLSAKESTNRELWERLATYLIDDHEKSGGGNIAAGTVVDYLGALLNMAGNCHYRSKMRLSRGAKSRWKVGLTMFGTKAARLSSCSIFATSTDRTPRMAHLRYVHVLFYLRPQYERG